MHPYIVDLSKLEDLKLLSVSEVLKYVKQFDRYAFQRPLVIEYKGHHAILVFVEYDSCSKSLEKEVKSINAELIDADGWDILSFKQLYSNIELE